MKKSILSLVLLLVVATVTNAAPRFGVIAEQGNGAGAFVTADNFNAQLTLAQTSDDAANETSLLQLAVGVNYKIALDSVTAFTVGGSFSTISGDRAGTEVEDNSTISLNVGFERALSSNLILTTQADVYEIEDDGTDITSSIFTDGRVGVAYLF
jgi:hypothetical protein